MGILDDAIRDHLELKRRHGASEHEVSQQAHEALGPARRGPAPAAEEHGAPPDQVDASEPPTAEPLERHAPHDESDFEWEDRRWRAPPEEGGHEHQGALELEADVRPPAPTGGEGEADRPVGQPALADPAGEEPRYANRLERDANRPEAADHDEPPDEAEGEATGDDEPLDEPEPWSEPPPISAGAPADAPAPWEVSARRLARAEPEPEERSAPSGADDVLEETPDFLEETPEHERLWFEQKPPRDFDFDD